MLTAADHLKTRKKLISFPYINKQTDIDPVNRLLVDITVLENNKPSQSFTRSFKYVFNRYFPEYGRYIKKCKESKTNNDKLLQEEMTNYYNTLIFTEINYKYKVGQFGYIMNGKYNLEKAFVIITEISKVKKELFFLQGQLQKYRYQLYDITSKTPKILTVSDLLGEASNGWITESLFEPIQNTITSPIDTYDAINLVELINWKISREDYLLKKMNRIELESLLTSMPHSREATTDDEYTSYFPDTCNSEGKCTDYSSTDYYLSTPQ